MRQFKTESLMVVDKKHKLLGILNANNIRSADVNLTAGDLMKKRFFMGISR